MPTHDISLTAEQDALKLTALRTQIKAGIDALGRGEFIEIEDRDLDGYLETLRSRPSDVAS